MDLVSVIETDLKNLCNITDDCVVFQQQELFPSAFPIMEEIRRQGKLCDVLLKVRFYYALFTYFIKLILYP